MGANEVTLTGFIADEGIRYWPKNEKRAAMALVTLKCRSANAARGPKWALDFFEIVFRGRNAEICGTQLRGGLYCIVLGRLIRDKWKEADKEAWTYRTRVTGSLIGLVLNARAQDTMALANILAEEEAAAIESGEENDDLLG